jgi:hypothetical protein
MWEEPGKAPHFEAYAGQTCDPESGMFILLQDRSKFAVALLCTLLAVVSILSPICSACDGLGGLSISHVHVAGKALPPTSDACTGVCSCCGFHWLPAIRTCLPTSAIVAAISIPEDQREPSLWTRAPFQPPRA